MDARSSSPSGQRPGRRLGHTPTRSPWSGIRCPWSNRLRREFGMAAVLDPPACRHCRTAGFSFPSSPRHCLRRSPRRIAAQFVSPLCGRQNDRGCGDRPGTLPADLSYFRGLTRRQNSPRWWRAETDAVTRRRSGHRHPRWSFSRPTRIGNAGPCRRGKRLENCPSPACTTALPMDALEQSRRPLPAQ